VATNNNLEHAVQTGKFRADLYYRLNAVTINMPSLRDRREDIPLLFRQFVNDFTDRNRTPRISLDTGATIVLQNYRFPGNIRQLKHIAESMCAIEGPKLKDGVITMDIARNYIPREADTLLPATVEKSGNITLEDRDRIIASIIQLRQEIDYIKGVLSKGAHISQPVIPDVASSPDVRNFEEDVTNEIDDQSDIEQEMNNGEFEPEEDYSVKKSLMIQIEKALEKHNGNRAAAAKELGISERTLYRKLKQKNADEKK
ncbi:MAG: sigma 54-interacting transcriptional regulator, partial [Bacteroidales bacterium]|nr:sigma 54-interacting transcriptional regulator [Bacteroidales bacterium]